MGGQRKGLSFHPGEKNQEGFLEEVTSKLRSGINQLSQSAKGRGGCLGPGVWRRAGPYSLVTRSPWSPCSYKGWESFLSSYPLPGRLSPSQLVWVHYTLLLGPSPGLGGLDAGRGLAHLLVCGCVPV